MNSHVSEFFSKYEKEIKFAAIIILAVSIISISLYLFMTRHERMNEIKFGVDSIPTFNKVIGKRNIEKVEKGTTEIGEYVRITYKKSVINDDDMNKYYKELINSDYKIVLAFVNNSGQIGKSSLDEHKILYVFMAHRDDQVIITYSKVRGEFTDN